MLKDNRLGQSKVLRKDFVQQLNIVCSLFTKNISINFYISIKLSQCFFCCNNIIIISWCENYFAAEAYSALLVIKLFNNLPFAPTKYLTSDIIYSINVHSLYHRFGLPWVNICCSLRVMNIRDLHNAPVILLCVLIFQLFVWLATIIYLY